MFSIHLVPLVLVLRSFCLAPYCLVILCFLLFFIAKVALLITLVFPTQLTVHHSDPMHVLTPFELGF